MLRSVFLMCVFAAAALTGAQMGGKAPDILQSVAGFLSLGQVRKELGISPAVGKKIDAKLSGAIKSSMDAMRKMPKDAKPDDRVKFMRANQARQQKVQSECLAMLSFSQKVRLKQIGIQQMGPGALLHPENQKSLALTAPQTAKIRDIVTTGTQKMIEELQASGKQPKTPAEARATFAKFAKAREAAQKKMMDASLKQLTANQRSKWSAIQGKPFKLDMAALARGR
jgi:hypothetical protein